jgi:hypothetical protein
MISIELTKELANEKDFATLNDSALPALFFGFIIKTEYDNQRLHIAEQYKPIKFYHRNEKAATVAPLYGILLTPNEYIKNVLNIINEQENKDNITLPIYENILNQFNFSCKETYRLFNRGLYPIDFTNLKDVCVDVFSSDKKIFQHMLALDENVFDFQRFASLKLFLLTK